MNLAKASHVIDAKGNAFQRKSNSVEYPLKVRLADAVGSADQAALEERKRRFDRVW
jgi:hypothetical protein